MRFMSLVKTAEGCEMATPELYEAIGKLSEEMFKAGVLLETGGLLPSGAGARVRLAGGKTTVTDGPFTEAKELIGGYAILHVSSKAEAVELGRRFLQVHLDVMGADYEMELELREMMDFDQSAEVPLPEA